MIPIPIQWNALRLVYVRAWMSKREEEKNRMRSSEKKNNGQEDSINRITYPKNVLRRQKASARGEREWEKERIFVEDNKKRHQIKINKNNTQTVDQKIVLRLSVAQQKTEACQIVHR